MHISSTFWDILLGKRVQKDPHHIKEGKPMMPSSTTSTRQICNHPNLPEITLQQRSSPQITEDTVQRTLVLIQDCALPDADPQQDYRPLASTQIAENITQNTSKETP